MGWRTQGIGTRRQPDSPPKEVELAGSPKKRWYGHPVQWGQERLTVAGGRTGGIQSISRSSTITMSLARRYSSS